MRKSLLIVSVAVFGLSFGCGGKDAKDKPATAVDTAAVAADTVAAVPDTATVAADTATTFTDTRDGQVYRIVRVGGQTWFAENLNYAAEGSVCYGNMDAYCAKYGRLYDWNTAVKACPAGTHLPTNKEWAALVDYAGGEKNAGKKLKTNAGLINNGTGTDDYGWSALPGGNGYSDGDFINAGYTGSWWSDTEIDANSARIWYIYYDYENVGWNDVDKADLFSVRCVADKEAQK